MLCLTSVNHIIKFGIQAIRKNKNDFDATRKINTVWFEMFVSGCSHNYFFLIVAILMKLEFPLDRLHRCSPKTFSYLEIQRRIQGSLKYALFLIQATATPAMQNTRFYLHPVSVKLQ